MGCNECKWTTSTCQAAYVSGERGMGANYECATTQLFSKEICEKSVTPYDCESFTKENKEEMEQKMKPIPAPSQEANNTKTPELQIEAPADKNENKNATEKPKEKDTKAVVGPWTNKPSPNTKPPTP